MNCIWILILSGVLTVNASIVCNEEVIEEECGYFYEDPEKFLPRNALELKEVCSEEEPTISCYGDFLERCQSVMMEGKRHIYIAAWKLINRVCYEDLRAKYLRNCVCFIDVIKTEMDTSNLPNSTCAQKDIVKEFYMSLVKRTCGREAVDLFLEYFNIRWLIAVFREDLHCD